MEYRIELSPQAIMDISELHDVISNDYASQLAARRYIDGIYKKIREIVKYPLLPAIYNRKSVRQYGKNIRRVNYKKMAILYTFNNDVVYIVRIMSGGSIRGIGAAA
ncbi:MAG: type II toxin-antitoxin system RelE/ParE family toxin [Paludibacter sp.]|nr:type II toxin-antitoxin system RelE/ParE family toxin [Prevotella sp.]MCM1443643.1 type II toxin-antitoxin system RelE/ParE family toxin [Muribaculum sp.]MCM1482518.1 type II toxin-antitoxin system RelE/ParE family toxin [Paludibacter sp.]MCM1576894.1 type II toxin-antitoxin system RelE/ParE family toxin [Bacteroides sp.]